MKVALIVAALAAVLLPTSAQAQKTPPFSFENTFGSTGQFDTYLEEYTPFSVDLCTPTTCVINRSGCAIWDINDHWDTNAIAGYLIAGATSWTSACLISYSNPTYSTLYPDGVGSVAFAAHGWFGVTVDAVGSSGLAVSVCWQPQDLCFAPAPTVVSTARNGTATYEWDFCGQAVYSGPPNLDPALGPIPNSNGGYGLRTTITVNVSNVSASTIKSVSANWGVSSDIFFPPACQDMHGIQTNYPFVWLQS